MSGTSKVHPLEGAVEVVKNEIGSWDTPFIKSVIETVWGPKPPFSVNLDPKERETLFRFALGTPALRLDFIERFGKERVAAIARKYHIDLGEQGDANG